MKARYVILTLIVCCCVQLTVAAQNDKIVTIERVKVKPLSEGPSATVAKKQKKAKKLTFKERRAKRKAARAARKQAKAEAKLNRQKGKDQSGF